MTWIEDIKMSGFDDGFGGVMGVFVGLIVVGILILVFPPLGILVGIALAAIAAQNGS